MRAEHNMAVMVTSWIALPCPTICLCLPVAAAAEMGQAAGWPHGTSSMPDLVPPSHAFASACCLEGQRNGRDAQTHLHCMGCGVPAASWDGGSLPFLLTRTIVVGWQQGGTSRVCGGAGGQGWTVRAECAGAAVGSYPCPTISLALPHPVAVAPATGRGRGTVGRHAIQPTRWPAPSQPQRSWASKDRWWDGAGLCLLLGELAW